MNDEIAFQANLQKLGNDLWNDKELSRIIEMENCSACSEYQVNMVAETCPRHQAEDWSYEVEGWNVEEARATGN